MEAGGCIMYANALTVPRPSEGCIRLPPPSLSATSFILSNALACVWPPSFIILSIHIAVFLLVGSFLNLWRTCMIAGQGAGSGGAGWPDSAQTAGEPLRGGGT